MLNFISIFFVHLWEVDGQMVLITINCQYEIKKGVLIGKTSEYLFLKTQEKITAIPVKSMVKEIGIK